MNSTEFRSESLWLGRLYRVSSLHNARTIELWEELDFLTYQDEDVFKDALVDEVCDKLMEGANNA